MIRRAVAVLALLALLVVLPACAGDSKETCAAEGGTWVSHTILMPVLVGKTTVLIPQTVWSCREPNRTVGGEGNS